MGKEEKTKEKFIKFYFHFNKKKKDILSIAVIYFYFNNKIKHKRKIHWLKIINEEHDDLFSSQIGGK
jgi:hypothetical protein